MKSSSLRFLTVGTHVAVSVLIGSFAGRVLDNRFNSEPWCFLAGFFLGAAAGFRELYRLAKEE